MLFTSKYAGWLARAKGQPHDPGAESGRRKGPPPGSHATVDAGPRPALQGYAALVLIAPARGQRRRAARPKDRADYRFAFFADSTE